MIGRPWVPELLFYIPLKDLCLGIRGEHQGIVLFALLGRSGFGEKAEGFAVGRDGEYLEAALFCYVHKSHLFQAGRDSGAVQFRYSFRDSERP